MTFQKFRTISSSDLSFARGRKIALSRISKFHPKQLIKVARNFLLACRDRDYFYMSMFLSLVFILFGLRFLLARHALFTP